MAITSVTTNKKSGQYHLPLLLQLFQQVDTVMANKCADNIIKNIIPHTPSKVGVLQSKTFSHTLDEARSVGLVKACVLSKNLFCYREISLNIINQTEWEAYMDSYFM